VAVGVTIEFVEGCAVGVAVGVGVMFTGGSQVTRMSSMTRNAAAFGFEDARWERNRRTSVSSCGTKTAVASIQLNVESAGGSNSTGLVVVAAPRDTCHLPGPLTRVRTSTLPSWKPPMAML